MGSPAVGRYCELHNNIQHTERRQTPTKGFQASGRDAVFADILKERSDFICKETDILLLGPLQSLGL